MDVRTTLAANEYAKARMAAETSGQQNTLGTTFAQYAEDFADTLKQAEATAKDAMLGKIDPHAMVEALAQTQLAVETAVTVRDKVVEAYQEILRMPV